MIRADGAAVEGLFDDDTWVDALRSATAPPPGGYIAGYCVVRVVQRGVQGTVYEGVEPATNRRVAIKRMPLAHVDADSIARFDREMQALAALEHASVVRLLAAPVDDGARVIVTEWVDGLALDEWCDAQWARLAPAAAVRAVARCLAGVAQAIAAAHASGVMHRDLKPSNVLVTGDGRPKVLDFGLAKALDASATLTRTQGFAGTPAWSAPEQVAEHAERVDARTDVHALGLLLYRGLVGRPAFDASRPIALLFEDIRCAVPVEPHRARGAVPRELSLVAMRALEKDPARRYLSADAMALDLQRFQNGEPVSAHPPSVAYLARKLVRRHWAASLAAGVVLLAVGAAVGGVVLAQRETDAVQRRADERQAFVTQLFKEQGEAQAAGRAGLPGDVVRRALADLRQRGLEPDDERALRVQYAEVLAHLGAHSDASAQYRLALELLPSGTPASERAGLQRALTEASMKASEPAAALAAAESWLATCERAELPRGERAEAWIALAWARSRTEDLPGALDAIARAGALVEVDDAKATSAWQLAVQANLLRAVRADEDAIQAAEAAVAAIKRLAERPHSQVSPAREAQVLRMAALSLRRSERTDLWPKSVEWLRLSLAAQERDVGERHPATLSTYGVLADSLERCGRAREAIELLHRGEQLVVHGLPWPDVRRAEMNRWIAELLLAEPGDQSVWEAERRLRDAASELVALDVAPEDAAPVISRLMHCMGSRDASAARDYAMELPGDDEVQAPGRGFYRALAVDALLRTKPPLMAAGPSVAAALREDLADAIRAHGPNSDQALVCEVALARCLADMGGEHLGEATTLASRAAGVLRARHGADRAWIRPAVELERRVRGGGG